MTKYLTHSTQKDEIFISAVGLAMVALVSSSWVYHQVEHLCLGVCGGVEISTYDS